MTGVVGNGAINRNLKMQRYRAGQGSDDDCCTVHALSAGTCPLDKPEFKHLLRSGVLEDGIDGFGAFLCQLDINIVGGIMDDACMEIEIVYRFADD